MPVLHDWKNDLACARVCEPARARSPPHDACIAHVLPYAVEVDDAPVAANESFLTAVVTVDAPSPVARPPQPAVAAAATARQTAGRSASAVARVANGITSLGGTAASPLALPPPGIAKRRAPVLPKGTTFDTAASKRLHWWSIRLIYHSYIKKFLIRSYQPDTT